MDDKYSKHQSRDKDLDEILQPLRRVEPTAEQLRRWANISSKSAPILKINKRRWLKPLEWAIAASIGFLAAISVSRLHESSVSCNTAIDVAENDEIDATEVRIFAK